jgi:hypothetical protein
MVAKLGSRRWWKGAYRRGEVLSFVDLRKGSGANHKHVNGTGKRSSGERERNSNPSVRLVGHSSRRHFGLGAGSGRRLGAVGAVGANRGFIGTLPCHAIR